jgi:tetratricopeptide (TPR) repeat protein
VLSERDAFDVGDQLGLDQLKAQLFGTREPVRRIGRYRVVDEIGRGGMGVVLRARDERLDRFVAIKLLPSEASDSAEQRARLEREARALARLSHPAVVQIHDVGDLDGTLWVAMEYVQGRTLRAWLDATESGRAWPDALNVLLDAGEGLRAAHDAGLVHRDFKPDNIMVADDGAVRVLDFGLARLGEESDEGGSRASGASALDDSDRGAGSGLTTLTRVGQVAGTPAYMAPERFEHAPADARSDQFSFCVTLWEALYGARPFASHEAAGLRRFVAKVAEGELDGPDAARRVPSWLADAVRRGLCPDPDARWPSLEALLRFLRERPKRRARVVTGVAIAASVLGALGVGTATAERSELCTVDEAAFSGLWDETRRDALERSFRSSGVPYAEVSAASVTEALDGWQGAWIDAQQQACEDTRIAGVASEARLDQHTHCLQRQQQAFATTVEVLANADPRVVGHAAELLAGLPDVERCEHVRPDEVDARPDAPQAREAVDRGYDMLAKAAAMRRIGRFDESGELAGQAEQLGLAHEHRPLELRARAVAAGLRIDRGAVDEGAQALLDVVRDAERERLDSLVAELRVQLATGVAGTWSQPALEAMVHDEARAWLDRNPIDATSSRELGRAAVVLELERGDLDQAASMLAALRNDPPPSERSRLREAQLAARLSAQRGQLGRAQRELTTVAEQITKRWGPGAKAIADIEFDLGLMALETGDLELAREHASRAHDALGVLYGAEGPELVVVDLLRARIQLAGGDVQGANEALEELAPRAAENLGDAHLDTRAAFEALGVTRYFVGEFEGSLRAYQRALTIAERVLGARHPEVAILRSNIGETLAALGRHEDALAAFRVALKDLSLASPEDNPDHAYPLKGAAKSLVALGRGGEAVPLLERALALHSGERLDPLERLDVLRSLALVLASRDAARARALAAEADPLFESLRQPDERTEFYERLESSIATNTDHH